MQKLAKQVSALFIFPALYVAFQALFLLYAGYLTGDSLSIYTVISVTAYLGLTGYFCGIVISRQPANATKWFRFAVLILLGSGVVSCLLHFFCIFTDQYRGVIINLNPDKIAIIAYLLLFAIPLHYLFSAGYIARKIHL